MRRWKTLRVYCGSCRFMLYKYKKGGTGSLIKVHPDRVLHDFTTGMDVTCPECGNEFARKKLYRGKMVNYLLSGRTFNRN
ncbi:unnamed protein product [Moneuplotes crassus]|uniref:Uncharacterized protein n=1 Tax=Euplotes crassus TaxID=5936 RepID=A0AAD1Y7G6_EUPCR|nr:unnamed protein product [Moneuplotes crassus]